jgi:transcription elongation factor GreA
MAVEKQYRLTKKGVDELQTELKSLVAERSAIAERIKTAREFGDLSENAEYQSARSEQEKNESRISEVEYILQNVELIKTPKANGKVVLGSTVKLRSNKGSLEKEFQVVGTIEADPLNGKVSDEAPIGSALMGKKVGDAVDIKTSTDVVSYKVVEIS